MKNCEGFEEKLAGEQGKVKEVTHCIILIF